MSLNTPKRAQWGAVFSGLVEHSLRTSQTLVRENANSPAALRPHLESILSQVEWGYRLDPALSAELLLQLDPWPVRWGLLGLWSAQLEKASQKLPGSSHLAAQIAASLATVYFHLGRLEQAERLASELLGNEKRNPDEFADLVYRCASAWISALTKLDRLAEAEQTCTALLERLEAAALQIAPAQLVTARAVLNLQQALFARIHGNLPAATKIMDSAIRSVQEIPGFNPYFLSDLMENRAIFQWAQGRHQAALDDLDTIQTQYISAEDELMLSSLHGNRGLIYWSMHRFSEAEAELHQAIAFTEKNKATYLLMKQVASLSLVCWSRGDLANTLGYINRQMELAETIHDDYEMLLARGNLAAALVYAGQPARGLPELLQSVETSENQGRDEILVGNCLDLAICYYYLNELLAGSQAAQKAFELVEKNKFTWLRVITLRVLALFQAPAEARKLLRQALQLARESGRRLDEAGCLLWLAHLASGAQRESHWQAACQVLTAIGAEKWIEAKKTGDAIFLPVLLQ